MMLSLSELAVNIDELAAFSPDIHMALQRPYINYIWTYASLDFVHSWTDNRQSTQLHHGFNLDQGIFFCDVNKGNQVG